MDGGLGKGTQEHSWLRAQQWQGKKGETGSAELPAGALPGSRTAAAVSHGWHRQAASIARSAMTTPKKPAPLC